MKNKLVLALSILGLLVAGNSAAVADNGAGVLDIKTGFGEQFIINNGYFGTKSTEIRDRLGDSYVNKQGLFGTKDKQVNFLGNGYRKKKGILGGTQVEATSMLGDSIQSKKSWFGLGRRKTNVDLSGVSGIVQSFAASAFAKDRFPIPGMNAAAAPDNSLDAAAGLATPAPDGLIPMEPMPKRW